jgi:hypothetical protein
MPLHPQAAANPSRRTTAAPHRAPHSIVPVPGKEN